MKYGVDVIIQAHEHSYERLWPVYQGKVYSENYLNPKTPIHIISGAAGCNEAFGVCVNPMLGPRGLKITSIKLLIIHEQIISYNYWFANCNHSKNKGLGGHVGGKQNHKQKKLMRCW